MREDRWGLGSLICIMRVTKQLEDGKSQGLVGTTGIVYTVTVMEFTGYYLLKDSYRSLCIRTVIMTCACFSETQSLQLVFVLLVTSLRKKSSIHLLHHVYLVVSGKGERGAKGGRQGRRETDCILRRGTLFP